MPEEQHDENKVLFFDARTVENWKEEMVLKNAIISYLYDQMKGEFEMPGEEYRLIIKQKFLAQRIQNKDKEPLTIQFKGGECVLHKTYET